MAPRPLSTVQVALSALVLLLVCAGAAPAAATPVAETPATVPAAGQDPAPAEAGADGTATTTTTTATTTALQDGEPAPQDPPTADGSQTGASTDATTGSPPDSLTDPAASAELPPTTDPLDPLSQEAPGETAPDTDITVPPPDADGTEDLWEPARILWSSVGAAERKLEEAEAERAEAVAAARLLRKRHKELTVESRQLGADSAATLAEILAATDRFRERAVLGFQQFGSGSEEEDTTDFVDYQQVVDDQRRSRMVDSALRFDKIDLERLAELQTQLDSSGRALLDRIRIVADHIADVEIGVALIDERIEQATVEYEAFLAGSQVFIHGAVFPIAPGYDTNLIDSWGFPRMVGTEDEHWHQGIDVFAPRGTPLVASERGVIERLGVGRLGGLKFWLRGESGSDWYYAHLDSFAPGLENGLVVEAGQLLGYVGNTGNAIGTPPHLHMQLHPGGGDPVNPYPLLQVISDVEQAAIAAGTFIGYDYDSVVTDQPEPSPEPTTTTTAVADGADRAPGDADTIPTDPVGSEPVAEGPDESGAADGAITTDPTVTDATDPADAIGGAAPTPEPVGDGSPDAGGQSLEVEGPPKPAVAESAGPPKPNGESDAADQSAAETNPEPVEASS
ncbi:MAG: M23 family metallopeptidase [Actinomycetota bacterium]